MTGQSSGSTITTSTQNGGIISGGQATQAGFTVTGTQSGFIAEAAQLNLATGRSQLSLSAGGAQTTANQAGSAINGGQAVNVVSTGATSTTLAEINQILSRYNVNNSIVTARQVIAYPETVIAQGTLPNQTPNTQAVSIATAQANLSASATTVLT